MPYPTAEHANLPGPRTQPAGRPPGWRLAMYVCNGLIAATAVSFAAYLAVRADVLSLIY